MKAGTVSCATLARSWQGRLVGLPLVACAALACTGTIGGAGQDSGGSGVAGGPTAGPGTAGPGASAHQAIVLSPATALPRLSPAQWENAVKDLLRLPEAPGLAQDFTPDPSARFDTSILERSVPQGLRLDYQRAAEVMAARVSGDDAAVLRLLPTGLQLSAPNLAQELVRSLGLRAYRRPLAAAEEARLVSLFGTGGSPVAGIALVLRAVLQSPHFLYRAELSGTREGETLKLDSYALAGKLSFALWNSGPSDELLAAAGRDELASDQGIETWVSKLLQDARAKDVLQRFHAQLLKLEFIQNISKDPARFPAFSNDLGSALRDDALAFVRATTVEQQGGIRQLLVTPEAYASELTAPLYGLSVAGSTPARLALNPAERAGFLTHVPYLAKNAGLSSSDPIHRGLFVVRELLCLDLPPPPAEVPPLPPPQPSQSTRERYEAHTGPGTCGAGCHMQMNAPGYALEAFDAVGAYRSQDAGKPVDTSGSLSVESGTITFANAVELSQKLATLPEVHACYSRQIAEYMLGRAPEALERPALGAVAERSLAGDAPVQLIAALAQGPLFRNRSLKEAP